MQRLTPDQIEKISYWAEKGRSGLWIAGQLGLRAASVNYRMLRAGFDPWPGEKRGGMPPGAFSPEEDAQMLALGQAGVTINEIARRMSRARTSIRIRLMTLEVRAEKQLEAA